MDLQFIQVEHRQNILKLMEVCGIEMKQAYDLYVQSDYNFEAAVNRKFNENNNPIPNAYPPAYIPQEQNYYQQQPQFFQNQYLDDQDDYKYSQYKQFLRNGKRFSQKYLIRKHETFFERIIPSFFKKQPSDTFKQRLEKYIQRRTNLKNSIGNLSQVLEWSWKQKYPVLIMILDFSQQSKQNVKRIFSEQKFVDQVLNQQFKLIGISALQYNLEQQLKKFFNLQRDNNHFIVCRVSHLQQIQIMNRISITESCQELKKKLKLIKSQCIQVEMQESNIVKQYQEQRKGNYNYKRPKTIKENLKFKQDKKIRKQQQQEFFKATKLKEQEQKPKAQQNSRRFQQSSNKKQEVKPQTLIKQEVISEQALRKQRTQKFEKLSKYQSGLTFKIRVPSGQNIIVTVEGQQQVQYLFDYIAFQPDDLGFANDISRKFDIFIGFGGSSTLKGKQKEQLKNLLEDSQVLIVREIAEE